MKKIPLTESWQLYTVLRTILPVLPVSPEEIRFVMLPKRKKAKKRNSSRKTDGDLTYRAYRFLGKPDVIQTTELKQITGACRFLWNRMLVDRRELYRQMGITLPATPADYKDLPELFWLKDCDSLALCNVQLNLEAAYSDWLSGKHGAPKFKKKGVCTDSYTTNAVNGNISLERGLLKLPKITGRIRLSQHRKIKPGGTLKNVTVTHEPDGRWYFSVVFAYEKEEIQEKAFSRDVQPLAIGLDMSLPSLYLDSDGNQPFYWNGREILFTKAYRKLEKKIAREQRILSHMVKDSSNYLKQRRKVAKLHAKAKHQRNDFLHQIAVRLARRYDIIGIEDLDMAALKRSLQFGKSISDNGWGNFIRILEEKCREYGALLLRVSKWYPSSKTCSCCGYVLDQLELKERTYICPVCENILDRDINAAINIRQEVLRIFAEYQNHEKITRLPDSYHYQAA